MKELLRRELQSMKGLYVGQLSEDELEIFEEAILRGIAHRYYDGVAGFLGLAKVGVQP